MNISQDRLKRLQELIVANPNWGRRKLADALKKEYGISFRMTTIAAVKESTLKKAGIPVKKPLGRMPYGKIEKLGVIPATYLKVPMMKRIEIGFRDAYHYCRSMGMTNEETRAIFSACGVVEMFNSDAFKLMLNERRAWIRNLQHRGWDNAKIQKEINSYYDVDSKRNPFDFLRDSYGRIRTKRRDLVIYRDAAIKRSTIVADIKKGKKARVQTKQLYLIK